MHNRFCCCAPHFLHMIHGPPLSLSLSLSLCVYVNGFAFVLWPQKVSERDGFPALHQAYIKEVTILGSKHTETFHMAYVGDHLIPD